MITNMFIKAKSHINDYIIDSRDHTLSELKQSLFVGLALFTILVCGPLLIFGSLLFLKESNYLMAFIELFSFFLLILLISSKKIHLKTRQFLIVLLLYSFSIILLISTANYGAGLVCVVSIMFLSGIIFEIKNLISFLIIDITSFTIITIMLLSGFLMAKLWKPTRIFGLLICLLLK